MVSNWQTLQLESKKLITVSHFHEHPIDHQNTCGKSSYTVKINVKFIGTFKNISLNKYARCLQ